MACKTYSFTTDSEVKAKADEILKSLGIPFSAFVENCAMKLIETGTVPFDLESIYRRKRGRPGPEDRA
ncbi:type II toxin-antitoxin system RelB/DinJ family antitoxin [Burkholderia sp. Cy-637]|uniref:type II toxin-antitoxin system RelB/DinJ family antitoxin n=1 Tax=Burkholderia sp. Cy-637 TaxID=2608327 RepID=UPI0019628573|nr:type II toxin-antitoxin system RelB/DinJ family antitoxin [Burkholderia sp. Cy-637]NIF88870.1 type II toxin-antitoxin system RelB/DinJ family antitoxin [Burkholderia sp. Cy-637]